MARKALIQIRRGSEMDIGTLAVGELGFCTDTQKFYIGTPSGNVLLVAAQTAGDMLKSIYDTDNDGVVDAAKTLGGLSVDRVIAAKRAVGTTEDWNNIMESGVYGVNLASLSSVYNHPVGAYGYGVLYVAKHGSPAFQMYLGHTESQKIWFRGMWNTTDRWSAWRSTSLDGHTHTIANINTLQANLDGKMKKGPLIWNDLMGV